MPQGMNIAGRSISSHLFTWSVQRGPLVACSFNILTSPNGVTWTVSAGPYDCTTTGTSNSLTFVANYIAVQASVFNNGGVNTPTPYVTVNYAGSINPAYTVTTINTLSPTAQNINGVFFANNFSGATADIKINSCLALAAIVNSTGNGICDATGLVGTQSLATNVFASVNTPVVLRVCSVNINATVTQAASSTGQRIEGCGPHITQFNFGGTGALFGLGSSGGNTYGISVTNLSIKLTADSSNGIAEELTHEWVVRDVYIEGNESGTQTNKCMVLDGQTTDNIFGNILNVTCNHTFVGLQSLSTGSVNKSTTVNIIGFNVYNDTLTGSKCFDYSTGGNGDGYVIVGGNCEASDYGIYDNGGSGHSAHFAQYFGYRFENITDNTIFLDSFSEGFGFYGIVNIDTGGGVSDSTNQCNTYMGNNMSNGAAYPNKFCGASTITGLSTLGTFTSGGPAVFNGLLTANAKIAVGGSTISDAVHSVTYSTATNDAMALKNTASGGHQWVYGDGAGSGGVNGCYTFYDQTGSSGTLKLCDAATTFLTPMVPLSGTFSNKPSSPAVGMIFIFTDSPTTTFYATISAGGGVNVAMGVWNGSAWIVM